MIKSYDDGCIGRLLSGHSIWKKSDKRYEVCWLTPSDIERYNALHSMGFIDLLAALLFIDLHSGVHHGN